MFSIRNTITSHAFCLLLKQTNKQLPNSTFLHSAVALAGRTAEDAIEFNEVRQRTENTANGKQRSTRRGRIGFLPELRNGMRIGQNTIDGVGIGELRAPAVSIANEEHLLLRVFTQTRKTFVHVRIGFHPVLIGLDEHRSSRTDEEQ